MRALLMVGAWGACAALVACGGKATSGGGDPAGTTAADTGQGSQAPAASGGGGASSGSGSGSPGGAASMHASQVVGSGFSQASALMAVGPNLYVTTKGTMMGGVMTGNGGLYMLPKAGGDALLLAADHRGAAYTDLALDADGNIIVGTSDGRLMRVSMFGGAETELMSGAPEIVSVAADATHVYFAHAKGSVMSIDYQGQNATLLAQPGSAVRVLSLAGDSLYAAYDVSKTGGLLRIHTADGTTETVASTGGGLSGLSVVSDVAYLSSQAGLVFSTKVTGGAVSEVAKAQPSARGVLADAASVYWLSAGDANLWRASHDGLSSAPIAQVPAAVSSPRALVTDDAAIYVLADAEVVRVEK